MPMPTMNASSTARVMIIRFLMTASLSRRFREVDAALFHQGSGRARELGARGPVVGARRDLVETGTRKVVLARQHQEVGGEAGGVAVALGRELNLGGFATRARSLDALPGGLECSRGIEHL